MFKNSRGPWGTPVCEPGCNPDPGCFCNKGYLFNVSNSACILPKDCNVTIIAWTYK